MGETFQFIEIFPFGGSAGEALQDVEHSFGAQAAEGTLSARLILGKGEEKAGDIDHAVGIVEHNQSARAHHGPHFGEGFIVDRGVGEFRGDASSGRTADLDGLKLAAVGDSAADFKDHLPDGGAHGHFDESSAGHLARQGKDLGSLAVFCADGAEPGRPLPQYPGDLGQRFHIVDQRGMIHISFLGRKGGTDMGITPSPLQGGNQSGLLAADKSPCSFVDLGVKGKVAAQNLFPQEIRGIAVGQGFPDAAYRQRIFCADIEKAPGSPYGIGSDDHPLDDAVGVRFQKHPVHKGTGIPLIAVADDIFFSVGLTGYQFPFDP